MPAVGVEQGQHLVQGQRDARPLPAAGLAKRAIGDDPIEPRSEGRLASERVDLGDGVQEGILEDLLRVLGVRRDADGQTIGSAAVRRDETLGGAVLAKP